MDLKKYAQKSNLGTDNLFILWNLAFRDIRVTLFVNRDVLDIEKFMELNVSQQDRLVRGTSINQSESSGSSGAERYSKDWVSNMIESLHQQFHLLGQSVENKYGHVVRLKEANIDFLTIEEPLQSSIPFNSLFIDVNFSQLEVEVVYPKIKVLKNLLDDLQLINVSRQTRAFRPRVRIMTTQDMNDLIRTGKYNYYYGFDQLNLNKHIYIIVNIYQIYL